MLARSYQSVEPYDAAVTQLRDYFDRLLRDGTDWSTPRPSAGARRQSSPDPSPVPVQTGLIELEGGLVKILGLLSLHRWLSRAVRACPRIGGR